MATHSRILAWKNFMDRGSWQGYSAWGHKELDMAEHMHTHTHTHTHTRNCNVCNKRCMTNSPVILLQSQSQHRNILE